MVLFFFERTHTPPWFKKLFTQFDPVSIDFLLVVHTG
jgi:hypothetical protein